MVEYFLVPGALLLLLGLLAVQFLVSGFSYGPKTRQLLVRIAVPAALVWVGIGAVLPWRTVFLRLVTAFLAAAGVYLAVAVAAVRRERDRKLSGLVGDVAALRSRMHARQREADRLFWELHREAAARRPELVADPPGDGPHLVAAVRIWQQAGGPREEVQRGHRVAEWRAEFRRCSPDELASRARVLQAVRDDAPDPGHREMLEARLALLWTVFGEARERVRGVDEPSVRERWEAARREASRLQDELGALLRQRAALMQRRIPLD